MPDPGALSGPDISAQLKKPNNFGVSGAASPDGVQTIELTTEPSLHDPHGSARITFSASYNAGLSADVSWGNRGRAFCRSADSIRVWGAFSPEVDLKIRAPGEVRLVAHSAAGAVLAGPTIVSAQHDVTSFGW